LTRDRALRYQFDKVTEQGFGKLGCRWISSSVDDPKAAKVETVFPSYD
jgi:hypothetical protein